MSPNTATVEGEWLEWLEWFGWLNKPGMIVVIYCNRKYSICPQIALKGGRTRTVSDIQKKEKSL